MPAPRMSTTPLPGIGVQYGLTTRERRQLSVIAHRDGTRTVNVYRADDPDACAQSLRLTEPETASLIDALAPSRHSPNLLSTTDLGLVAERIELSSTSYWNGRSSATPGCGPRPAPRSSRYCAGRRRSPRRRRTSGWPAGSLTLAIALGAAGLVLVVAVRYGRLISRFVSSDDAEKLLLVVLGLTLLVAGVAQQLQVSAAVGAFLVGIALSGEVAEGAHGLLSPLRDLFAAVFFVFFGLHTDPASIPPVLLPALALAVVTAGTKIATGYWPAKRAGVGTKGRWRAGGTLVARGEFSIVIAGLAVTAGIEPSLGPLATAYVLILVVLGPLTARYTEPAAAWITRHRTPPGPRPAAVSSVEGATETVQGLGTAGPV